MAILKNLIVNGASRFLGKTYFQDVQIGGSATLSSLSLSGNLSVTGTSTFTGAATFSNTVNTTGNITSSGNLYANGGYLYLSNKVAADGGKTVANQLTINGSNAFTAGTYIKNNLKADTLNATNVNVSNNLHATHFDLQTVAQLGGSFYVSPTLKFPNSGTQLGVAKTSGSTTLTLTITDSSITSATLAGIVWTVGSCVKVSGTINGVVTGTMDGTITGINPGTNSGTLTISCSGENSGSVAAGSYSASQFSDLSVMVYQRRVVDNNTNYDYRVGIWMNCYDLTNSSATIRVYGGTDASPNVTIGNLSGMTFNGSQITGNDKWGILTSMGYFEGAIVSNEGQIGGFTIGDTTLSNGTFAQSGGVFMSTGKTASNAIGGSSGSNTWAFTAGNTFGVTTAGKLYATSGNIAGWRIEPTYFASGTATAPAANVLLLSPSGTTSSYTVAGTAKSGWMITAGTTFGVNKDGGVYATSGKIGGWTIGASSLYNVTNSLTSTSAGIYLGTDGIYNYKDSNTYVKVTNGVITAKAVDLTGKITATSGEIGGCSITNGVLYVTDANISGTISSNHINASGITIGQSQVTNLTTDLGNKASSSDLTALSNKVTAVYGESNPSSTNASEQVKVVTCSNFELFSGALITVKFTYANAYASGAVQLNVNSKGAKNIWVANAVTSTTNQLRWGAGAVITFRYDGSAFIVVGEPREWYGTCSTAAGTSGKVSTDVAGCVICKGAVVSLSMTNDNTATSPSLNIVYTGSINLYAGNGTTRPTTANGLGWTAGSTVPFVFDGQYWRVGDTASLSRASDAAKTATNYISTINNTGIKVSYATNSTNYLQITADGTSIYKNSVQVANYGDSIVLGELASGVTHVEVDSDSFDVCVGTGTGNNATKIATFGETVIIGKENDSRISMTNSNFGFLNSSNDSIFQINDQSISLGKQSDGQFIIQSDRMNLYDSEANSVFSVQKGGGGTTTLNSYAVFNQKVTQTRLNIGDEGEDLTDQTVSNFVLKTFRAPSGSSTYVQQLYYAQVPYCTPITEITIPSNYYTISNMEYTDLHTSFTLQFTQEGANYIHGIIDNDCDPNMMRYAIFYDYTYNPPSYSVLTMNGNINADEIIAGTSVTSGDFIFNSTSQPINEIQTDSKNVTVTSTNKIDQKPTIGAQLTLYWGTYLLLAHGDFNSGSSSGARIIQLAIYTGINPVNTDVINASRVRVVNAAAYWSGLTTYAIVTVPYGTANTFTVGLTSSIAQSSTSSTSLQAILLRPVEPT